MLETVFFTIASQVVSDICLETGKEKGTGAITWVGQVVDGKCRELIYNWSKRYVENYAKRHGILKVLGMSEHMDLDSIYTKVRLLSNRDVYRFASVDGLEEAFREARRFWRSPDEEKPIGFEVVNTEQYLMVLGAPGAGKSTFLRKIGLEALKGRNGDYQHQQIPVFLELKRFNQADIDITAVIAKEFEICKHPRPREYAEAALEEGKLVILFDGLDEVPTELQNNVMNAIEDFVDQYDKNRFVASCRVAAYNTRFRRFRDVAVADFDDSQIEQFIQNWFRSERDRQMETGKKCWELLTSEKHRGARELAQTPLLLTFLCLVYDRSQTFPENRSQLYDRALRILLEEWAAEKRLPQEKTIYEGLHTALEEELLADIAFWGFEQDKLFFQKWELVEQIQLFLGENLNAPKTLNGEAVLNAIAVQQGIFVERAENIYSFSHLTLQEYLTAKYIVDNNLIEQSVETHITDKRWQEVFILIAGLAKGRAGADPLLLAIEKCALNHLSNPTGELFLIPLLRWAERITKNSPATLARNVKRAIALATADTVIISGQIYKCARLYETSYSSHIPYLNYSLLDPIGNQLLLDHLNAYCEKMQSMPILFEHFDYQDFIQKLKNLQRLIPQSNNPYDTKFRDFRYSVLNTFRHFLALPKECIQVHRDLVMDVDENYFYLYTIIIYCKMAAVRVSPSTWQAIEDRMFLPPED